MEGCTEREKREKGERKASAMVCNRSVQWATCECSERGRRKGEGEERGEGCSVCNSGGYDTGEMKRRRERREMREMKRK